MAEKRRFNESRQGLERGMKSGTEGRGQVEGSVEERWEDVGKRKMRMIGSHG